MAITRRSAGRTLAAFLALLSMAAPVAATREQAPPASAASASAPRRAAQVAEVDPALAEKLQTRIERWRKRHHAPAVAAAVRLPDDSLWIGVSGRAEVGRSSRRARAGTPFVLGSITKSFMSTLVLQLQEEGRLSIDAPISTWLPDYPNGETITLRMLLDHRSGIFNYFEHPRYESLVFGRPRHHWTVNEILRLDGKPYFAPNMGFHYSNTNYVLVGRIVQEVTGRDPHVLIRRRFLRPLGLDRTFFQGEEPIGSRPAKGYWTSYEGGYIDFSDGTLLRPNTSAATVAWTAGGLVSSVRDLSDWAHALFEGDVLTPESLALMLDFRGRSSYGLGMRAALLADRMGYGHGGSLRGFVSGMYRLPDEDIDVVFVTNLGNVSTSALVDGLARIALRAYPPPEPLAAAGAGEEISASASASAPADDLFGWLASTLGSLLGR